MNYSASPLLGNFQSGDDPYQCAYPSPNDLTQRKFFFPDDVYRKLKEVLNLDPLRFVEIFVQSKLKL